MHTAAEGQWTAEPPTELLPRGPLDGFSEREEPQCAGLAQEGPPSPTCSRCGSAGAQPALINM